MAAAGRFVDDRIVGRPPERRGTTWLHLSGPSAGEVAELFRAGPLEPQLLGPEIGEASALKAAFAAWTKDATALKAVMLAYPEASGVRHALEAQWERYEPGFLADVEDGVRRATAKAWRFEGEMHEIADAFEALGLTGGFHRQAAEVYRRLARSARDGAPAELDAVLRTLRDSRGDDG